MSKLPAIIPARGGSKRLPGKNIRMFCGEPLIVHSIRAALAAPSISVCYVTTDDKDIANVALQAGAKVIDRPDHLAQDNSSTADALLHALDVFDADGIDYTNGIALLQPTNPLRPVSFMEAAIQKYLATPCDSLISVSEHDRKDGTLKGDFFTANYVHGTASQDMPTRTFENGLLYLTKAETLRKYHNVAGERVLGHLTPTPFGEVDIDEELDFQIAECIYPIVKSQLGY